MRRAVALFLLALPATSFAQQPVGGPLASAREDEVIFNTWSDPAACSQGNALSASVREIARHPKTWTGKCVRLRGWWKWNTLFSNRHNAKSDLSNNSLGSYRNRIGVYGRDQSIERSSAHPILVTAIGVVGTCEALGDGTIMVMGYCHYRGGPYIALSSAPTPIP